MEHEILAPGIEIYQGDCLDVMRGMPDKSVDAVITDPLYNHSEAERFRFHKEFTRISKGAVVVFCPPENQWMQTCDQWLFWIKPISTKNTSKSYSRFVEMIQVWNGPTWNADRHWSQYTNVFNDLVDDKMHPYAKPLSLMVRLILNHINPGDTILDPFLGSGTTGVACVQTGRRFIGIELDPDYYAIARKRITEALMQPRLFDAPAQDEAASQKGLL